jgi:hypothetical protein
MSLDVDLMVIQPVSVFSLNITHNLGKMASKVILSTGQTLYDILWRPDENGYYNAEDISELLYEGLHILISSPEEYKKYNPENGWGEYDGLVQFVKDYHMACIEYPSSELRVSR